MKLENFSLLYPDSQTQRDHLAGVNVPDIDMYTLQELGMLEIFNPQSTPLSDFFTSDPAVISYRNQTFSDMLCNPALTETLHRLVPVLQDITELRRLENDIAGEDTASYLASMTEIELYITCVDILHKGMKEVRGNLHGAAFRRLADCVTELAESDYYAELNRKLSELTRRVREIRSVTIGVNLDAQLRPAQAGVLSINAQPFKSGDVLDKILRLNLKGGRVHLHCQSCSLRQEAVREPEDGALACLQFRHQRCVPLLPALMEEDRAGLRAGEYGLSAGASAGDRVCGQGDAAAGIPACAGLYALRAGSAPDGRACLCRRPAVQSCRGTQAPGGGDHRPQQHCL
ncbi:MAG: hypothetical protein L6V84_06240 [Oscillospiraceae bacterium]|nr:MAG: hypothetical protein L6V84_06240 [Oscillospiraceae bacterium]